MGWRVAVGEWSSSSPVWLGQTDTDRQTSSEEDTAAPHCASPEQWKQHV